MSDLEKALDAQLALVLSLIQERTDVDPVGADPVASADDTAALVAVVVGEATYFEAGGDLIEQRLGEGGELVRTRIAADGSRTRWAPPSESAPWN